MNEYIPFRWDISHREQLGTLLDGDAADAYPAFIKDLRICCAKVLACCKNSDLIFVGRSPESLYDYLSGVTRYTSYNNRLHLLNVAMRYYTIEEIRKKRPKSYAAMQYQFEAFNLDPRSLIMRKHPIAFVDIVCDGTTLRNLSDFILFWAKREAPDYPAVKRKIIFIGLTWQRRTSLKNLPWVKKYSRKAIKTVPVPGRFWDYIGNKQKKVEDSNWPLYWGSFKIRQPSYKSERLQALRLAHRLYNLGTDKKEKLAFIKALAEQKALQEKWIRELVQEIKYSA